MASPTTRNASGIPRSSDCGFDQRAHADRHRVQKSVAIGEGAGRRPALSDVAGDKRCADYRSRGIAGQRHRDRHRNPRAVLAQALGVEWIDLPTIGERGEDSVDLLAPLLRNDHPNALANRLVGAIAEQALGALVPTEDRARDRFGI